MLKKKYQKAIGILVLYTVVISLTACENSQCPEGTLPILDTNGDVIDCTLEDPGSR